MRKHLPLIALLFLLSLPASGGDESAAPTDSANTGTAQQAEPMSQEDLMDHLARVVDEEAKKLIAGQPDARSGGEVALVVGVFHHMGLFYGLDTVKAREFMEMALERGVPEARVALGELHLGYAIPGADPGQRDVAKALEYLNTAAEADSVDAQRLLGILYTEGTDGLEPDPEKAEHFFLKAARHGDPEALSRLEPLFERVAAERSENPEARPDLPATPDELVDPALAEAARARGEELNRVADLVGVEIEKWALRALAGE